MIEQSQEQVESKPGVWIKTFGCQMNEYDSEKMLLLLSATHRRVERPEDAEILLVNTCSVREKGEHKLFSLLGELRDLKSQSPDKIIGVSGCVAQQEGQAIIKRNASVDFVLGTHNLSLLPSLVQRTKQGSGPNVAIDYRDEWEDLPDVAVSPQGFTESLLEESTPLASEARSELPFRALIAIQRGCDKVCSFCVVPNTRGPQVSRSIEEILREVRLKARMGAKEVLLLGQTVNSYGIDLQPRVRFEELIRRIAEVDGVHRIRFTSPHPQEVRKGFLDLYAEVPELCPHIHLPLQSGSDRILKLMNRNYRRERYLDIVHGLRERCPHIALSTDIIVGYPTETEEDFEQTLDLVRQVRYTTAYAFKYSRRPHTAAISMHEKHEEVPDSIARERLQRLFDLQDSISAEVNSGWLGSEVEVLVESKSMKLSGGMRGRIPQNTLAEIVGGEPFPGELVRGRVVHTSAHGLRVELI